MEAIDAAAANVNSMWHSEVMAEISKSWILFGCELGGKRTAAIGQKRTFRVIFQLVLKGEIRDI